MVFFRKEKEKKVFLKREKSWTVRKIKCVEKTVFVLISITNERMDCT